MTGCSNSRSGSKARGQAEAPIPFLGTVRRLAADALASAVVSVMLIGGYFVYRSTERLPLRFGVGRLK